MTNSFQDDPLCKEWLEQFEGLGDKESARTLLSCLKLVSHREFENFISESISRLCTKVETPIAVYPITDISRLHRLDFHLPKDEHQTKLSKKSYGSENRISHILSGIARNNKHVIVTPDYSMLNEIKNIVLVDDIFGSGKRVIDFWKNGITKRIKSRLSYKKNDIKIIVYSATPSAVRYIKRYWPKIDFDTQIFRCLSEIDLAALLPDIALQVCQKYAAKYFKNRWLQANESSGLGYRDTASPIIFEHGCPNNVPEILTVSSSKWKALFPHRKIPEKLTRYFGLQDDSILTTALERSNQVTLATKLASLTDYYNSHENTIDKMTIAVLGLMRRRKHIRQIKNLLFLNDENWGIIINNLILLEYYDGNTERVTDLGKNFLNNFRSYRSRRKVPKFPSDKDLVSYYPRQCGGESMLSGNSSTLDDAR